MSSKAKQIIIGHYNAIIGKREDKRNGIAVRPDGLGTRNKGEALSNYAKEKQGR